jgi:hypothetical protein
MLGNTLTSYRRLIIRDDPQAASKYIADYIIGAPPAAPLRTYGKSLTAVHRAYQNV